MSPEVMKPENYAIVNIALSLAESHCWFITGQERADREDVMSSAIGNAIVWG